MTIDNVGKYIVKDYRIHNIRQTTPAVVTATLNIRLNGAKKDLQKSAENLPGTWRKRLNEQDVQDEMEKEKDTYTFTLRR